ncbi:hypothetical protein ACF1GT_15375 [Streptomyces sp. NPDC014636]|uniref:hypothetical protein n=1 Tax=Streptomyces sp. NPDC014636 TaxID=3364876 RepID=UPI0036F585A3
MRRTARALPAAFAAGAVLALTGPVASADTAVPTDPAASSAADLAGAEEAGLGAGTVPVPCDHQTGAVPGPLGATQGTSCAGSSRCGDGEPCEEGEASGPDAAGRDNAGRAAAGQDGAGHVGAGQESSGQDGAAQEGGGQDGAGQESGERDGAALEEAGEGTSGWDGAGQDSGARDGAGPDGGGDDDGGKEGGGKESGGKVSGGKESGGKESGGKVSGGQDGGGRESGGQDGGGYDDHGCAESHDASCPDGHAAVQHGVAAGQGGSFDDSVPALATGGALIAAACAGAGYRVYGRLRPTGGRSTDM